MTPAFLRLHGSQPKGLGKCQKFLKAKHFLHFPYREAGNGFSTPLRQIGFNSSYPLMKRNRENPPPRVRNTSTLRSPVQLQSNYFKFDFSKSEIEYTVKLHSSGPWREGTVSVPAGRVGQGKDKSKCIR